MVDSFGVLDEAARFGGWIVTEPAAQADNPLVVLDWEACPCARAVSDPQANARIRIAWKLCSEA